MKSVTTRVGGGWYFGLAVAVLSLSSVLAAAERKPNIRMTKSSADPTAATVDLFPAMDSGQIDARIIMQSSKQATVLLENKTDKPLNVRLPDAFVGVLAQAVGGGNPFGGGAGGVGGGQQAGGFGGNQFGGAGGAGGGALFNIPPQRVGEIRLAGVCLEHGKDEPRPTTKYVIKPLETFSNDPALREMLKLHAENKIDQRVAQAAAWHIASKMSWEQLAAKQVKRIGQVPQPYFSPQELRAAVQLVSAAKTAAEKTAPAGSASSGATAAAR